MCGWRTWDGNWFLSRSGDNFLEWDVVGWLWGLLDWRRWTASKDAERSDSYVEFFNSMYSAGFLISWRYRVDFQHLWWEYNERFMGIYCWPSINFHTVSMYTYTLRSVFYFLTANNIYLEDMRTESKKSCKSDIFFEYSTSLKLFPGLRTFALILLLIKRRVI